MTLRSIKHAVLAGVFAFLTGLHVVDENNSGQLVRDDFIVTFQMFITMIAAVPRDVDYRLIKQDLQRIPGVKLAHSLNVWSLTMDTIVVSVHLAVGKLSHSSCNVSIFLPV